MEDGLMGNTLAGAPYTVTLYYIHKVHCPQTPTGALSLDPAGGDGSPPDSLCPP